MSSDRRQFLKLIGASTLLGVGAVAGESVVNRAAAASERGVEGRFLGIKWGLVVDAWKLYAIRDYRRIIDACHEYHNVPNIREPKHAVKWIWTEDYRHSFPEAAGSYIVARAQKKHFLVLCNHCDNAPCVRVCPVQATFKREDGLVMQDMHRCIGCKFCMAACPYGARSYNWLPPRSFIEKVNPNYVQRTIGVVEKCTLCNERLDRGLAPVCVAESGGAIVFGDLNDPESEVRQIIDTHFTIRRKAELGTDPKVYYVV